jgi:hypothetical protein
VPVNSPHAASGLAIPDIHVECPIVDAVFLDPVDNFLPQVCHSAEKLLIWVSQTITISLPRVLQLKDQFSMTPYAP